jgi:hypothetical protein
MTQILWKSFNTCWAGAYPERIQSPKTQQRLAPHFMNPSSIKLMSASCKDNRSELVKVIFTRFIAKMRIPSSDSFFRFT